MCVRGLCDLTDTDHVVASNDWNSSQVAIISRYVQTTNRRKYLSSSDGWLQGVRDQPRSDIPIVTWAGMLPLYTHTGSYNIIEVKLI